MKIGKDAVSNKLGSVILQAARIDQELAAWECTCWNLAKIVQGGREDAPTAYRAPPLACSQQTERPERGKTLTRWRCPATTVWCLRADVAFATGQVTPLPVRARQARTRAASCGIEKGLVR